MIRNISKEFIDKKYREIKNERQIIILESVDKETEDRIHNLVMEYTDMVSFSIGNERVVLRYRPSIEEYLDLSKLLSDAHKAYKNGNYDKCIENCLMIFKLREVKSFVYNLLGLSYYKKGEKDLAIDYLTITNYMFKEENNSVDYTELIAVLKGQIDKSERKPLFRMDIREFYNDEDYGIRNIDQIIIDISESNLDVDTFCEINNLNQEQINIIKLIIAKKYFLQGAQYKDSYNKN